MNIQSSGLATKIEGNNAKLYILLTFENSSRQYIFTSYNNSITINGYHHSKVILLNSKGSSHLSTSNGIIPSELAEQLNELSQGQENLHSKFNLFMSKADFEEFKDGLDFSLSKHLVYDAENNRLTTRKQFVSARNFVMFSTGIQIEESEGMDTELLESYLTTNPDGWKLSLSLLPEWMNGYNPTPLWDNIQNIPSWITLSKPTYSYSDVGAAPLNHSHPLFDYLSYTSTSDALFTTKQIVTQGGVIMFSVLD